VALTHDVVTACAGYWSLAWDDVVATAARHGIAPVPGHAGSFETSIVLSLWPELVAEAPRRFRTLADSSQHPLSGLVVEKHRWVERVGWYTDDPSSASAEAGREILDVLVAGCETWLSRFVADDSSPFSQTEGS
jgi:creatinine amidohydrolase